MDPKVFFDAVRPMSKGGRLSHSQVIGFEAIIEHCLEKDLTQEHIAYVLATAWHETGGRMEPVREGFASTDEGAVKAVTNLFERGIISRNYSERQSNGNSYYGRGFVQLTHLENYAKTGHALGIDLVTYPDLMLDLDISVRAMVWGMTSGSYRNKSLNDVLPYADPTEKEWIEARDIINGDTKKNGKMIAGYASKFYQALEGANNGTIL
jgi:predicted chitinase